MTSYKLNRIGYGNQFNDLFIIDDIIIKKSKSEYGNFKISKEILFFQYILNNNIPFTIPEIIEFGINYYRMKYLSNYTPLYKSFLSYPHSKQNEIINLITNQLNLLHNSTIKLICKKEYTELLVIETHTKIKKRYEEISDILKQYSFIKKVNNVELLSFDNILGIIQNKMGYFINSLNEYKISVIHGDCQFNNILTNDDNHLVFIDPRGYFGNLDLYGLPEYDFAKVKFALSGYDIFDNMEINSLEINNDNLTIPNIFIINDNDLFKKDDIISILTISIWLGNAHCFKDNVPKAIFSFYYALYLATLYL